MVEIFFWVGFLCYLGSLAVFAHLSYTTKKRIAELKEEIFNKIKDERDIISSNLSICHERITQVREVDINWLDDKFHRVLNDQWKNGEPSRNIAIETKNKLNLLVDYLSLDFKPANVVTKTETISDHFVKRKKPK